MLDDVPFGGLLNVLYPPDKITRKVSLAALERTDPTQVMDALVRAFLQPTQAERRDMAKWEARRATETELAHRLLADIENQVGEVIEEIDVPGLLPKKPIMVNGKD